MGINFTPKTETVTFPGGEFSVRGLALEDFTVLLRKHYEPMAALFDRYVDESAMVKLDAETGGQLNLGDLRGVILAGLEMAPGLVGDLIARAADETENPDAARTLPLGVQIEAVTQVVSLTLEAEGGMEKLLETVTRLTASLPTMAAHRSR